MTWCASNFFREFCGPFLLGPHSTYLNADILISHLPAAKARYPNILIFPIATPAAGFACGGPQVYSQMHLFFNVLPPSSSFFPLLSPSLPLSFSPSLPLPPPWMSSALGRRRRAVTCLSYYLHARYETLIVPCMSSSSDSVQPLHQRQCQIIHGFASVLITPMSVVHVGLAEGDPK